MDTQNQSQASAGGVPAEASLHDAFSSLAQIFHSTSRNEAIPRFESLESSYQSLAAAHNRTQESLRAAQRDLSACIASNRQLHLTLGNQATHIKNQDAAIAALTKDVASVIQHHNSLSHYVCSLEKRLSAAHHSLNERTKHAVSRQAEQMANFQNQTVGNFFAAIERIFADHAARAHTRVIQGSNEAVGSQSSCPSNGQTASQNVELISSADQAGRSMPATSRSGSTDSNLPLALAVAGQQLHSSRASSSQAFMSDFSMSEASVPAPVANGPASGATSNFTAAGIYSPHPLMPSQSLSEHRSDTASVPFPIGRAAILPTPTPSPRQLTTPAQTNATLPQSTGPVHQTQQQRSSSASNAPNAASVEPIATSVTLPSPSSKRKRTPSIEYVASRLAKTRAISSSSAALSQQCGSSEQARRHIKESPSRTLSQADEAITAPAAVTQTSTSDSSNIAESDSPSPIVATACPVGFTPGATAHVQQAVELIQGWHAQIAPAVLRTCFAS